MAHTATTLGRGSATTPRTRRPVDRRPTRQRATSGTSLPPRRSFDLNRSVAGWLADGKSQGWSSRTLDDRAATMQRFAWWLEQVAQLPPTLDSLSPDTVRAFLAYTREPQPAGRYGSDRPSAKREARLATVNAYFRCLRAFSNFCIAEGWLRETPLQNVKAPKVPKDQIKPFSEEQVQRLLDAARRTQAPERNVAVILLLVDTGMRISELCQLNVGDVDRGSGELTVTGKGNKKRQIFMGVKARRALWRYLEADRREALDGEPLLVSIGGTQSGGRLTKYGGHQVIANCGREAGISGVRCSPHTCRHTFAINFLRGGGNLLELQKILGHEDLTVLKRYVELAQSDLAEAHRSASPADRMKLR